MNFHVVLLLLGSILVAIRISFFILSDMSSSCTTTTTITSSGGIELAAAPKTVMASTEDAIVPLPVHNISEKLSPEEQEFWKQPQNGGFEPCIEFSDEYRQDSGAITAEKRRFLIVSVDGGLNQQRNEIIDAVVIARILGAALVVPVLQRHGVWKDDSEFSEIFDVEHFKATLRSDVMIVSSLPAELLTVRIYPETLPPDSTPDVVRSKFQSKLMERRVIYLYEMRHKLSRALPLDLQRLRCKVAFQALKFAANIRTVGEKLAERIWKDGPYIALHLRLEKDVWVHAGCLPEVSPKLDAAVAGEQKRRPELVNDMNMTYEQRREAGYCPLNADQVARLLKALGAPRSGKIYLAGGEPYGGAKAVKPLSRLFPNLTSKEKLAFPGELEPFMGKPSALAAVDYIISLNSGVFMPSTGGNMAHALQGHRAYIGHRKVIRPHKGVMAKAFLSGKSLSDEEFSRMMKSMHQNLQGQPLPITGTRQGYQDVTAFPVPECMCKRNLSVSL
ncbi:O-fucosyltransferase 37-like [Nymphaea colorata]|nr:O-fucosyltransferase 37-like [Nymphaea colorata]